MSTTVKKSTHLFTLEFASKSERDIALNSLKGAFRAQSDYFAHFYSSGTPSHLLIGVSDESAKAQTVANRADAKKCVIEGVLKNLDISSYEFVKNVRSVSLNNATVQPTSCLSSDSRKYDQLPSVVQAACGKVRID